ncbi:MAG TPA: SRPBCC family protein [Steroidobacteraceae bacterium]
MRFLKGLVVVSGALVALFFIVALLLPRTAHVERSVSTTAAPETVYGLVNGFARFNDWSPWSKLDPKTRYTYSGPVTGVGARMEWTSASPDVGNGSQEVIAVEPNRSVTNRLDLGMGSPTTSTVSLAPEGSGTRITWTLDVDLAGSLVGRYFGLMLDRMVGPDYERGLQQLKAVAESETPVAAPTAAPGATLPAQAPQPGSAAPAGT